MLLGIYIYSSFLFSDIPSIPIITGGPFMEGTRANLTCNLSDPGNPVASLSWSWEDDGTPLGNNKTVLTLLSVSRRDNNRTIICRAQNFYTEAKNITVEAKFTLTVYCTYSVLHLSNNYCMHISPLEIEIKLKLFITSHLSHYERVPSDSNVKYD